MSNAEDMPNPPYGAPASAWMIWAGMPSSRNLPAITSAEVWSFAWWIRTAPTPRIYAGNPLGMAVVGVLTRPNVAGRCSSDPDRARAPVDPRLGRPDRLGGDGGLRVLRRQGLASDP